MEKGKNPRTRRRGNPHPPKTNIDTITGTEIEKEKEDPQSDAV